MPTASCTVTAPTEAHKECADLRGTVGITYFSANGQADAVMMDVVADADYRGETVGEDFTVNITEITDKNIKATITPKDDAPIGIWDIPRRRISTTAGWTS